MSLNKGFMVVVDISGYTTFIKAHSSSKKPSLFRKVIEKINDGHGEHIISDLLETVINELEGTLTINKLEGDAALFYAIPADATDFSKNLIRKLENSIEIFNKRINELLFIQACPCIPCNEIVNLKLKCFVHYGDFLIKKVSRFKEIAGENVIILHRLMKNSIPHNEYILFTEEAAKVSAIDELKNVEIRTEKLDDFGKMQVQVHYPSAEEFKAQKPSVFIRLKNIIPMRRYFSHKKTEDKLKEKLSIQ